VFSCYKKFRQGSGLKGYVRSAQATVNGMLTQVTGMHPESVWLHLAPKLFITFWSMTLYDLKV
jgi:hypothetical protein